MLNLAAQAAEPQARPTRGFAELSDAYVALAIQGDLRDAERLFNEARFAGDAGAALREQFVARFLAHDGLIETPPAGLADGVARSYRKYWRRKLMHETDAAEADAVLDAEVSNVLSNQGHAVSADVDPWPVAERVLRSQGLHVSAAATPPWRDLFVWSDERRQTYPVELTDGAVPVEVVFMDGFVVQGWKDFASLGLAATTGWVENGRLYCVAWAYDVDSENFAVSYLKHEARHLADLERYPDMDTTELEYRAKLTELAFASGDLQRIWNDFRAKAAENPDSPHAMANWRVVRDVKRVLDRRQDASAHTRDEPIDARRLNEAARQLLQDNTRRHEAESPTG